MTKETVEIKIPNDYFCENCDIKNKVTERAVEYFMNHH